MKPELRQRRQVVARLNPVSGAVALAVGSMSLTGTLSADEHDDAFSGFFEEITVTATRRASDVQDVPYNIAAFSGETLQQQRITNLQEFARWVPGLTLTDQGNRTANLLTVRGLNASSLQASEFLENGGGETVSTYLGDIPLYIDLKPYDIDRVEVLIGPQGTLYGAGTLAGAVRYIPNRPNYDGVTLDTHFKGYYQDKSDDLGWGLDATLNVPLVEDKLAFRGTLGYVEEAGFIDYPFLVREPGVSNPEPDFSDPADVRANLRRENDVNDEETLSARAALLWDVTEDFRAVLTWYYQNMEVGGRSINHRASFNTGDYESGHRYVEPNERENNLLALEITWDLGFAELTSATGVGKYEDDGQRDQTDLLLNFEYGYEDFPAFAAFTRDTSEEDTITQELRLVSNADGRFTWIAGFFYSDFEQDAVSLEFTPGIPEFFGLAPPPLPTGDIEYRQLTNDKIEQIALFGEVGFGITDNWQVTGGLRWFDYENETTISVDLPLIDSFGTPETADVSEDDVTWKINTSYALDEGFAGSDGGSVYFTISTGYRLGGVNVFALCESNPPPPGQNVCLLPEEKFVKTDQTTNYEVGLKSNWLDNSLLFNASLFYVEWEDVQVESTSFYGDVPITVNAAEAESTGIELQSRWQINDSWAVFATYAYTSAELSKDSPSIIGVRSAPPNEDAFKGDRLPGTPEHQGSFNVNYSRPAFNGLTLDLNYGFTAISDVYTKTGLRGRGETLGGFTVHNASVSLSGDKWTATLFADNFTNKFARTGVRADTDFIDTVGVNNVTLRRYYHNVIRPRKVGLDIRYYFDF
ncbi:MAG: TonB-dependent receptor [Gammaproteobacteria bacterium]|nr:TonB-dependent receptor [Gammaproteobacteria bacterium]